MATRTRLDSSTAAKPKTSTNVDQGRRTTGALSRSSSGGKSTGSVATQHSPSYLRSTQSVSRTEPSKLGVGPTKPTSTTSRRQSIDRTSLVAQTQRVLSTGPRERSVTVKSPSLSSSKSAPTRAELGRSKMMTKPIAPSRSGSGSGSRSGSVTGSGKTVNKSTASSPSLKPDHTQHFSDDIEAEPRKSDVPVKEEKLPPISPQPTMEDHGKLHDEPLEHVEVFEEEDQIHNQYQEENVEPEEEEHHGSILTIGAPTDKDESSKDNEVIEAEEEIHHDTIRKSDAKCGLEEEIPHENHDDVDEPDHHSIVDKGGEGTITESPTEQPPPMTIKVANEAEEKIKPSLNAMSPTEQPPPKLVSNEETGESTKIEAQMLSKSPPKVQIRAQNSSSGKKESPVYNDVIKEAAGKLLEKRKNRVSALVGAFETVISLQEPDT